MRKSNEFHFIKGKRSPESKKGFFKGLGEKIAMIVAHGRGMIYNIKKAQILPFFLKGIHVKKTLSYLKEESP